MRVQSAVVLAIAMAPVMAAGQQSPTVPGAAAVDPNTRFEVASIKPAGGADLLSMRMLPGRIEYAGTPAAMLLLQALQKPDYQIVGVPGWAISDRYAISAKAPEGVPQSQAALNAMIANLLKDRFQLAAHVETRELPVFDLVTARADRRLGADLKATSAECQATIAERLAAAQAAAAAGRVVPPQLPALTGPNDPPPCGFIRAGDGRAAGSGRTVAQIASLLQDITRRPVVDKTRVAGVYDFTLRFTSETRMTGPWGLFAQSPGAQAQAVDPDAPSLAAALQEQLGLKLENARGPVEIVVIDKLEKPTLD